jgi:hypothetical protein
MFHTAPQSPAGIPLAAALEIATRRTVAHYTAQARPRLIAQLDRAESALTQARQLAQAIA